jgi:hypothetical protein
MKTRGSTEQAGEDAGTAETGGVCLLALLRRTLDALVRSDAEELQALLRSIGGMKPASGAAELAEARSLHRVLGALLKETQRTLRLWRRAVGTGSREPYGSLYF